jgi:DNA-binding NarL/FixJ family response regulator
MRHILLFLRPGVEATLFTHILERSAIIECVVHHVATSDRVPDVYAEICALSPEEVVVVADINTEPSSGPATIRLLRDRTGHRIPTLFVVGNPDQGALVMQANGCSADWWIAKPYKIDVFADLIRCLLAGETMQPEGTTGW